LARQADGCAGLGSALYAELLGWAADEVQQEGAVFGVLSGHEDDPEPSALALRLMGAVHRLVLRGDAPSLAAHYPSAGGQPRDPVPAFRTTLRDHAEELRALVDEPVQTNEPARCAALLGGFLEVARATRLPLRLLEVGASAGLNLHFDRYRYDLGGRMWGAPESPVLLRARLTGRPPLAERVSVASRQGCDARPVDPASEHGRLTLACYVWADQLERLARLRAACDLAARFPAAVEQASAPDWVEDRIAEPAPGVATVVFHSIVIQYLDDAEGERLAGAVRSAGERANRSAPVAWLRMEPADRLTDVHVTVWPGGEERHLARAGYHGDPVEWLAG
jgi:hypothetical protein